MIKFKLYFDKDEETKWLNQMAAEGWAMKSFFAGFYTFEKCEKGKYIYQVDFGEKFGKVTDGYKEFMEDTGVEIVQCWGYWIILRKLSSEGEFRLYTDVESSIAHYSKILKMFKAVTVLELVCLMVEVICAMNGTYVAWAFAFLIGAMVLTFIKVIIKTKNTIAELEARQVGIASEKCGRNVSALLPVGLLFNSCALGMQGSDSISDYLITAIQILAIVFMLAGLVMTARKKTED